MIQNYKYIGVVSEVIPVEGLSKPKVNIIMDAHDYNGKSYGVRFDFFGEKEVESVSTIKPGDTVELLFTISGGKSMTGLWFSNIKGISAKTISSQSSGSATASATPSNPPAPVHVQGATMDNAVGEWKKWKGDSKEAIGEFGKFCQGLKPGKASKDYTAADWGDIVNAIRDAVAKTVAGGASSPSQSPDDIGW